MSDFTPAINTALNSSYIRDAEFIRLTITNPSYVNTATMTLTTGTSTVYSMSTSFQDEIITDLAGYATTATGKFTALGGLVNVSGHQRDLSATSYDTQITLVGIDPNAISRVLEIGYNPQTGTYHAGIKGARIQIWRGFYDAAYTLIDTPQLRYTGIVTSYHISEERQQELDAFTLSLNCSSFKTVLENRFAGRHTNGYSWNTYNGVNQLPVIDPATGLASNADYDTGMDRVQAIHDTTFNFGLPL